MKTRIVILSVVSLLALITVLASSVSAQGAHSHESNATIEFTEGEGSPPVLDPTDPSDPYEPGPNDPQNPPTGCSGPLTLDYVSSVDFGEHPIESGAMIYESTILRPFIQVTDRRGTGAGWHVTAQLSEFSENEALTLPGAVLTFTNGSVISPSVGDEPIPADPVVLHADGAASTVVSAEEDTGLGTWITRWFPTPESELNDNVTLKIPAGAATLGDHSATITWTISDTPGQ